MASVDIRWVIGNRFPEIGEQVDQWTLNCGPKISSDSISTNSYNMKLVYHDWDRAVKKSDDIFGSVLRYKRHELDSCSTGYPVWLLWRLFQWKFMVELFMALCWRRRNQDKGSGYWCFRPYSCPHQNRKYRFLLANRVGVLPEMKTYQVYRVDRYKRATENPSNQRMSKTISRRTCPQPATSRCCLWCRCFVMTMRPSGCPLAEGITDHPRHLRLCRG